MLAESYSARTMRSPASTSAIKLSGKRPIFSVTMRRSTDASCVTLTVDECGKPVCRAVTHTFPGSVARAALVVRKATMTVRMAVTLNSFADTMTAGRRYPGSDPLGTPALTHQISPRFIVPLHREQSLTRYCIEKGICGFWVRRQRRIEPLGDAVAAFTLQKFLQGRLHQFAARNALALGFGFSLGKKGIGKGDGGFHTKSITKVIPRSQIKAAGLETKIARPERSRRAMNVFESPTQAA